MSSQDKQLVQKEQEL
jgi:hypothetical protein